MKRAILILALAVIGAAAVTSCFSEYTADKGETLIVIDLGGGTRALIDPESLFYRITLSGGPSSDRSINADGNSPVSISVIAGRYNLKIEAYTDSGRTDLYAKSISPEYVDAIAGQSNPVTVVMRLINTGEGNDRSDLDTSPPDDEFIFTLSSAGITELKNGQLNYTLGVPYQRTQYTFDAPLNVEVNETLTILPGTELIFSANNNGIYVAQWGTLIMEGQHALLNSTGNEVSKNGKAVSGYITLKGFQNQPGYWKGVEIRSTNSNIMDHVDILNAVNGVTLGSGNTLAGIVEMTNCLIQDASQNGIYIINQDCLLKNFAGNIITNCGGAPIHFYESYGGIWTLREVSTENDFSGNVKNYIDATRSGTIDGEMTLRNLNVPWRLSGTLFVEGASAKLSAEPGAVIEFSNTGGITVRNSGTIDIRGTEDERITFTSALAGAGAWDQIFINTTRDNVLDYVDILYGFRGVRLGESNTVYGIVTMTNSRIEAASGDGIWIVNSDCLLKGFTGNVITNCGGAPISFYESYGGILALREVSADNDFSGNAKNYIDVLRAGTLDDEMILRKLNVPWRINGTLTVSGLSAKLSAEPGAQIEFTNTGGITVQSDGIIDFRGTADEHVTLTAANPGAGAWNGISIRSVLANVLDYVDILYPSTAVTLGNGNSDYGFVTMTNCLVKDASSWGIYIINEDSLLKGFQNNTVTNCGDAPIHFYASYGGIYSLREIGEGNDFSGNANDYIDVTRSGTISADMTLKKINVPYRFSGTLAISDPAIFTIEPGAELWFDASAGITVSTNALLVARGTPLEPILFKSRDNITIPGYWNGITISSAIPGSRFANCTISGGGRSTNTGCLTVTANRYVELLNVNISDSLNYGIYLANPSNFWSRGMTAANFSSITLDNVYYNGTPYTTMPADTYTPSEPME